MLMDECDADTIAFCNHFKCENPYKLLASQYDRAMHALKAKKKPMTDDQLAAVGKKIAGKS